MSDFKFSTPQGSVGLQFWKLHAQWQKKIAAQLCQYKITHTQFVIMASVMWYQEQGSAPSQAEISNVTGIEKMTLSKAIMQLEGFFYVKKLKSQKDRRSISVSLTDKGLHLIPTLIKIVETIDIETLTPKKNSDKALFVNVIAELLKNGDPARELSL